MSIFDIVSKLGPREHHEKIDKLRELGVADEISLPQLVAVGDQSCGKSSLLEALTGLPFPIASGICTKFATRIVFRRRPQREDTTTISIIPGSNSFASRKDKIEQFSRDFGTTPLTRESFVDVISKAANYMEISDKPLFGLFNPEFSDDILNVEISGPNQLHLSIIDLPGLFHNSSSTQSAVDKATVLRLVRNFIKDRRTIILAVLNATVDLALQEVFSLAKEYDPLGLRTVGIMTHCDSVQKMAEAEPVNIALNKVERLHHGWYCVRNRTPLELLSGTSHGERNEVEQKFFEGSAPWSAISPSRRGAKALMEGLYQLLSKHITCEYPSILAEINAKLENARRDLHALGTSRQSDHEQAQYLVGIAAAYRKAVEDSLNGHYSVRLDPSSKLRTLVQNANDTFNVTMKSSGVYLPFHPPKNPSDESTAAKPVFGQSSGNSPAAFPKKTPDDELSKWSMFSPEEIRSSEHNPLLFGRTSGGSLHGKDGGKAFGDIRKESGSKFGGFGTSNLPSLQASSSSPLFGIKSSSAPEDALPNQPLAKSSSGDIYGHIRKEYKESRGTELPGHVNPALLERLFYQQSQKWERFSTSHVKKVWETVSLCHRTILQRACGSDKTVLNNLTRSFNFEWEAAWQRPQDELEAILTDERTGPLLTGNDEFARNLSEARTTRIFDRLRSLGFQDGSSAKVEFQKLASLVHPSNEDFTVFDVHDTLKAYYDVALKRFIDNVITIVVERSILGPKGPLQLFSPNWVASLSREKLASITQEEPGTRRQREELGALIARLEKAKAICSGDELLMEPVASGSTSSETVQ